MIKRIRFYESVSFQFHRPYKISNTTEGMLRDYSGRRTDGRSHSNLTNFREQTKIFSRLRVKPHYEKCVDKDVCDRAAYSTTQMEVNLFEQPNPIPFPTFVVIKRHFGGL